MILSCQLEVFEFGVLRQVDILQCNCKADHYYLYSLFVQGVLIKVQDGCFYCAWWRQDRQADVDGITSFGVQDDDLLTFPICRCFLKSDK